MHIAVKYLSNKVNVFEITFLRCALVIFVFVPFTLTNNFHS
jgi:hypothetical protein